MAHNPVLMAHIPSTAARQRLLETVINLDDLVRIRTLRDTVGAAGIEAVEGNMAIRVPTTPAKVGNGITIDAGTPTETLHGIQEAGVLDFSTSAEQGGLDGTGGTSWRYTWSSSDSAPQSSWMGGSGWQSWEHDGYWRSSGDWMWSDWWPEGGQGKDVEAPEFSGESLTFREYQRRALHEGARISSEGQSAPGQGIAGGLGSSESLRVQSSSR